jgi:osmotically-inducible protein OsmY
MKSDQQLRAGVFDELRSDQRIAPSTLGVSVNDGVVTLFGEVDSLVKRNAATSAAARVPGIRAIADEIRVHLPHEHLRSDADIAHDAVHALMWDTEVPDKTIRVRVQDRWIWLVGEAESRHQRQAAERAVESIRGVKGITNLVRLRRHPVPADLQQQIEASLARNTQLAAGHIAISIKDSAVVLNGVVQSWSERESAENCAWARGVTTVENKLVVAPR